MAMFTTPVTVPGDGSSNTGRYVGNPDLADHPCSHRESFKCYIMFNCIDIDFMFILLGSEQIIYL